MIFFTALNDLWDFCAQFGWTFLQNQLNKLSEFGPVTPGDIIIHYLFIFIMLQSAVSYRRFHNVFKTAALRKIKNISIMARNAYRILFFQFYWGFFFYFIVHRQTAVFAHSACYYYMICVYTYIYAHWLYLEDRFIGQATVKLEVRKNTTRKVNKSL